MGRFLTSDENVHEAIRSTLSRGHDGILHVSERAEQASILSNVESAAIEGNICKKKFISNEKEGNEKVFPFYF